MRQPHENPANDPVRTGLTGKTIAYVGPFRFPEDSALGRRIMGMATCLRAAGCNVVVGSGQRADAAEVPADFPFKVSSLNELPRKTTPKILKAVRFFVWGRNTLQWLRKLETRPSGVLMCGGFTPYSFWILPWCKLKNIPVMVDVIEWYQPSHVPGGAWGPFRWNVELATQFLHPRTGHIIAISTYLQNYYQGKGCQTVRIPPILDVSSISVNVQTHATGPIVLAYAGVPGKKDLLNNVVEALLRVDPSGKTLKLTVAGPKVEEILAFDAFRSRNMTCLPECVEALGRVSQEKALDTVRMADFSVLLRPIQRYARAGFPTKVPESLAVGTPVLCNLTTDLGFYVHDGQEGIIVKDSTAESCVEGLRRVLSMTVEQRVAMRLAARLRAEQSFDYRNWVEPLREFMQKVFKTT